MTERGVWGGKSAMVTTVSLLPLASAAVALAIAILTLLSTVHRSRQQWLFLALNVAVAAWCLGYFFALNYDVPSISGADTTAFAPIGTTGWLVHVLASAGMAAVPTLWFLFAADRAHRARWLSGGRLVLACAPAVYTFVMLATNPLHHLAIVAGPEVATLGPTTLIDQLTAFVLIVAGGWMIAAHAIESGDERRRRSAVRILVAAALPVAGGAFYYLRAVSGDPLAINPAPELFVVLEIVLAHELLFAGLADISPQTAPSEEGAGETTIVVDEQLRVVRFTRAAGDRFPLLLVGKPLCDALPEVVRHAEVCMYYGLDQIAFEVPIGSSTWWGRAHRRSTADPLGLTCVLQLTEVAAGAGETASS